MPAMSRPSVQSSRTAASHNGGGEQTYICVAERKDNCVVYQ